jgi:hypothetical protein
VIASHETSANKAVEDGSANPLRFFAAHLTATLRFQIPPTYLQNIPPMKIPDNVNISELLLIKLFLVFEHPRFL